MSKRRSTFPSHPGVDPSCRHCKGESFVVEPIGEHAHARLCTCVKTCSECRGTGLVARGPERLAPKGACRCRVTTNRIARFNQAQVPSRHAHCTLATFEPNKNIKVFAVVNRWIAEYDPKGRNRGIVLYGDVGRGKTHLMVAILRELIFRHGVSARFVEFSHLIADLKGTFDKGGGASEILEPLTTVQVLAVDELGKGRNTEYEGTVVDELISRRYNAASTIVGTSNYGPGPQKGRPAPNLAATDHAEDNPRLVDRVGHRVYSRLEEMADFHELKGPDHRQKDRPWSS